eukprot:10129586-Ditylum_brightwellii.AAC.1
MGIYYGDDVCLIEGNFAQKFDLFHVSPDGNFIIDISRKIDASRLYFEPLQQFPLSSVVYLLEIWGLLLVTLASQALQLHSAFLHCSISEAHKS